MSVYVLRHAKAGSRRNWDGPDTLRPLSKPGHRQSEALAEQLAGIEFTRVLSSPYTRCRETVKPIADRRGLEVEISDALAEGKPLRESLRLVEKSSDETTLLCTHGDIVAELLAHAERHGVVLEHVHMEKGSMWVLTVEHGTIVAASYVPPPA